MIEIKAVTADGYEVEFGISVEYESLSRFIKKTEISLPVTLAEILTRFRAPEVALLNRFGVFAIFCACGIDIVTVFAICGHRLAEIVAALELREECQELSLIEILGSKAA